VTRFFEPVLRHRDAAAFEVYCYSDTAEPDGVTERFRGMADAWRNVRGVPDAALADQVRHDRIDILDDLAGHMAANRLPVFARKPAPVQVSYLGYPNTTGVDAVDYRITDSMHDPPGRTEHFHSERLLRLDPCCWCYAPDPEAPDAGEPPALRSGGVTFAVLNKPAKATTPMVRAWAQILREVPRARLLVLGGAGTRLSEYETLREGGLPADRVELVPRVARDQYFALYRRVDVALDTFPYNGHTTTCDALWMGVPTVTLPGQTHVTRAGLSGLSAAGVADGLVADGPADYVSKAVALAGDVAQLLRFRASARDLARRSPLCDGPGHAARLARAYREAWAAWCAGAAAGRP
jgi:predicted O-linked N-acetylglucosamine transferase (SPINDLY family)